MSPDTKLLIFLGAMHLAGMVFVTILLILFLRSDTVTPYKDKEDEPGDGGGGTGGGDAPKTRPPSGGIPLPDAVQSSIRLRGTRRAAFSRPTRDRSAPTPSPRSPRIPR